MARRPNIVSAGSDFAFAALALIAGLFGAAAVYAAMIVAGALVSWAWTRRAALAAMAPQQRFTQGAIAVAMIAITLALLYWIGLMFGGHN